MNLGKDGDTRSMVADIFLYNENLNKINLSGNNLFKLKIMFKNISRNYNLNLSKLILSRNDFDMFDFRDMIEILEPYTKFGEKQYFKLRYISLSSCPNLWPFENKMKEKLDEFYKVSRKVFIQYKSRESWEIEQKS